jgi:hypothetical protein
MYKEQVRKITKDLKRTKKAIIAIGCSFVQGQGAVDDKLYQDYTWEYHEGRPLTIDLTDKHRKRLLKGNSNLKLNGLTGSDSNIDFTMMEYDNAFVNVLCNKYFNKSHTPINLGIRGCGNRASIKELYMYPEINYDDLTEIIVLYAPSGLERFDFINDEAEDHFNWKCMWPHYEHMEEDSPRLPLWKGYSQVLHSDKFEVLEQIAHVQELLTWCKYRNARLVITPGFDRRYDKEYFNECLSKHVERKNDTFVKSNKPIFGKSKSNKSHLIDLFPWSCMFKPAGFNTFADLVISKEDKVEDKLDHYGQFLGKGSPDKWITPCSHPSQKGHDLFASYLYTHIAGKK